MKYFCKPMPHNSKQDYILIHSFIFYYIIAFIFLLFVSGIASYDDSFVYIPVIEEMMNETSFLDPLLIQNSSSCVITIPAMSENGTSGGLVNLTLLNSELGQQDLSDLLNGSTGNVCLFCTCDSFIGVGLRWENIISVSLVSCCTSI